jgi:hypothetical protein
MFLIEKGFSKRKNLIVDLSLVLFADGSESFLFLYCRSNKKDKINNWCYYY